MVSMCCGISVDIFTATVVLNHDQHICHFTSFPGSAKKIFFGGGVIEMEFITFEICMIN